MITLFEFLAHVTQFARGCISRGFCRPFRGRFRSAVVTGVPGCRTRGSSGAQDAFQGAVLTGVAADVPDVDVGFAELGPGPQRDVLPVAVTRVEDGEDGDGAAVQRRDGEEPAGREGVCVRVCVLCACVCGEVNDFFSRELS